MLPKTGATSEEGYTFGHLSPKRINRCIAFLDSNLVKAI